MPSNRHVCAVLSGCISPKGHTHHLAAVTIYPLINSLEFFAKFIEKSANQKRLERLKPATQIAVDIPVEQTIILSDR
jgi:hypothetical protein